MMPYNVDRSLRSVLSRVLIRRILKDRVTASQIQNRIDFENLDKHEKDSLRNELSRHVPRTIVALDEAQELLVTGRKRTGSS